MLPTSAVGTTDSRNIGNLSPDSQTAVEDRRASQRLPQNLAVTMTPMGYPDALGCRLEDISAGGMFVCVPDGADLRVGQRVEVALEAGQEPSGGSLLADGETWYATVIRTEQRIKDTEHVLGAGLRFDHPLFIDPASLP